MESTAAPEEHQLPQMQPSKQVDGTLQDVPEDLDSLDVDVLSDLETRTSNFCSQRVPGPMRKRETGETTEVGHGKRQCTERNEVQGLDMTLPDGTTLRLSRKATARSFEEGLGLGSSLLEKNIHTLAEEVAVLRSIQETKEAAPEPRRHVKHTHCTQLWVDKHRPKSFLHLLSDERTNRNVLAWIKAWDSIVFGTKTKESLAAGPEFKVLLLHGPPGTGKTTLAHILAKHAGYKAVEINASDERTASGLRIRLEALMEMKAMFGDGKPNCIILDEIDGSAGAEGQGAVDLVVKLCKDTASAQAKGAGGKDSAMELENEGGGEEGGEEGEGTRRGRGGAKRKKTWLLRRPVICICNDLYAPALRPLRTVAQLVKFTPPNQQRMIARLQHICHEEKLSVDRQALSLLHEMHNGDIRSCINALQTISVDTSGHVDVDTLREKGSGVRDCNMSIGLFDVWNAVFKLPGASDKSVRALAGMGQGLGGLLNAHFGNMQLILQGCHHNMLKIKYNDPRMIKTVGCLEALGDTDLMHKYIAQSQNYTLSGYLKTACLKLHHDCASPQWPQIEYPRQISEATAAQKQHRSLLAAMTGGMAPAMRHFYDSRLLVSEVLPFVQRVLQPAIKLANMHLMSAEQKEQLQAHVEIMIGFGLHYRPVHGASPPTMAIEPNFEDVIAFPKRADAQRAPSPLALELMKHLQQMLEVSLMKKSVLTAASKTGASSSPDKSKNSAAKATKREEVAKEIKTPPKAKTWGHAGWASATQHNANRVVATCNNTHPARYRFNEGVTRAIKRTVHMKDLL